MTLNLTSPYQAELTSVKTIPGQIDVWSYIPEKEYALPDPVSRLKKLWQIEKTSKKTVPDHNDPWFDITIIERNEKLLYSVLTNREAIAAIIGTSWFFLIRRLHRRFLRPGFLELTFSLTSVTSTALQWKLCTWRHFCFHVNCVTYPTKKIDFWSHLWD